MPVRITMRDESGPITLLAHGAMPTEVRASGNFDGVVPWLAVTDSLREPRWAKSPSDPHPLTLSLKALDEDERLVAFAGGDADIAKLLFPGKAIVPIALDLSRSLLETAEAWESLDAIVLSEAAAARLDDRQRARLLCSGAVIAIHGLQPPDFRWRPHRVGDYWVLRWNVAGPTSVLMPDAYTPTYNWDRGWSVAFRRQVMLFAAVFTIFAMGIVLWPSRWAVAAFFAISTLMTVGFSYWYFRQSPVLQLEAAVAITTGSIEQQDTWSWQSPLRATTATRRSLESTHPMFASLGQVEATALRLICGPTGAPDQFAFTVAPGQSLAFLDRTLQVALPDDALQPASPIFTPFVDQVYTRAGGAIVGQVQRRDPGTQQLRPVIVVRSTK